LARWLAMTKLPLKKKVPTETCKGHDHATVWPSENSQHCLFNEFWRW
jgi:hypothetical protein